MEPRSLKFIAEACDGKLVNGSPDKNALRICTDSRQAQAGDLFIAIKGDRFDGHDFLAQVAQQHVAAILAEHSKVPQGFSSCPVIGVENTRKALGQLASRYRADFDLPVIAVGGSNGKTTTKELVAAVLRQKFPIVWSEASFNNDIGVPLTILKIDKSHKAAVVEVGTNHPGELATLLQIVRPRYSVITSIGREHLEFFSGIGGVVQEQAALAEFLPNNGKLFINGENEWMKPILRRTRTAVVKVGQASHLSAIWGKGWTREAAFCARNVRLDGGGVTFSIVSPREELTGEYRVNLLGRHQVTNALLAIAIGSELGLEGDEIRRGLAECQPAKMRMQVAISEGVTVLDDAYNANADSMLAALQTLHDFPCSGRRIAVLGDMAELGEHTNDAHREIGRRAAELGINHLFAVGKLAPITLEGARRGGLKNVTEIADAEQALAAVRAFVKSGDVVLVKASRSSRLERIAEPLKGGKKV